MEDFIWGETVTIKEVWLDPTRVNESGRGKWDAILAHSGTRREAEICGARWRRRAGRRMNKEEQRVVSLR